MKMYQYTYFISVQNIVQVGVSVELDVKFSWDILPFIHVILCECSLIFWLWNYERVDNEGPADTNTNKDDTDDNWCDTATLELWRSFHLDFKVVFFYSLNINIIIK